MKVQFASNLEHNDEKEGFQAFFFVKFSVSIFIGENMKLKALASVLSTAALFAACSETVTNVNEEAKDEAKITLKVVNAYTGEALDSVEIYSLTNKKTKMTDSLGIAVWKSNVIGDYAYEVSKEGYATQLIGVSLGEQGQGDVARVGDVIELVEMVKSNVTAKGTVLYKDYETGNLKAAKEVNVFASLPDGFVPSELVTKTDSVGKYSFKNLPEGVPCTISVGQKTISDKLYASSAKQTISDTRSGDIANIAPIQMEIMASKLLLVSNNLDAIDSSTTVKLTYSTEIEADSLTASNWTVTQASSTVLVKISLDKDGKTVKISPFSGEWDIGSSYSISGKVYSTEGTSEPVKESFTAGKSASALPSNVSDLKASDSDEGTNYVNLSWKAPKGKISGYHVYYKTDSMSDFVKYESTISATKTEVDIWKLDFLASSLSFTSVEFVVLPFTEAGEASIADAKTVKYTFPKATP